MTVRTWATVASIALLAAGGAGCANMHMPQTRAQIEKTPNPCVGFTVSLYFEKDSWQVTKEATDVLRSAEKLAKGCAVTGVDVVGLADSQGAPSANLELSKRRARAVTASLSRVGFRGVTFSLTGVGDAGAETASGNVAPLRRRADVNIHLAKR